MYQGLFFNKIAGLRPAALLKNRLWYRCQFCEISKNISGRLLLLNDSFHKYYRDSKKIDKMFRKLNYFFLAELFREKKYRKTKREKTKRKNTHVYDTPSEFYYKFQERWIQ